MWFKVTLHISEIEICPTAHGNSLAYTSQSPHLASHLLETAQPNDICFHFPNTSRQLFASSKLIIQSPYLVTLVSSAFSEGQKISLADYERQRLSPGEGRGREPDYVEVDSDAEDETGDVEMTREIGGLYHHITITDATFNTYRAVLHYLYTSTISFAPLKSSFLFPTNTVPTPSPSPSSRPASTSTSSLLSVNSHSPVSPKSIYKLSHFLELPELAALALEKYKSQLTIENVAWEIYSDLANDYEDILNACLDVAVPNWTTVRMSAAMNKVKEEWDNETRSLYPKVAQALLMRL